MSAAREDVTLVLDANILIQDFGLGSPSFRKLLSLSSRKIISVVVPEVVVWEVVRKYGEEFKNTQKSFRRLAGPGHRDFVNVASMPPEDVQSRYEEVLRSTLDDSGVTVAPFPKVSHEEIARRDYARKKPFNEKGKGYRDTLIWHTVLELAAASSVCLVTANSSDFCGPQKDVLAPELMEDSKGLYEVSVRTSLADAVTEAIPADSKLLIVLREKYDEDAGFRTSLNSEVLRLFYFPVNLPVSDNIKRTYLLDGEAPVASIEFHAYSEETADTAFVSMSIALTCWSNREVRGLDVYLSDAAHKEIITFAATGLWSFENSSFENILAGRREYFEAPSGLEEFE